MSTSRIWCNNFDIIRFRFRWISFAVTSPQPFLFHIWTQLPFHYTCVIYWKSHIWRFCFATVSGYIYCTVHIMVIAINVTSICFQHKVNFHYFVCGRNPLLRVMFKGVFTQWNEYIYIISYCNASSNGYLATVNKFFRKRISVGFSHLKKLFPVLFLKFFSSLVSLETVEKYRHDNTLLLSSELPWIYYIALFFGVCHAYIWPTCRWQIHREGSLESQPVSYLHQQ